MSPAISALILASHEIPRQVPHVRELRKRDIASRCQFLLKEQRSHQFVSGDGSICTLVAMVVIARLERALMQHLIRLRIRWAA